ncbi:molecular chaperone HscC [Sphingobium sp. HBC34]|uniref:Molecular chaperone HscC n=1 Tax=Sphingobium cyanobacteriorum TaxID=3063954 RepID=A0ABT8ZI43_9SPHN|nr:molecular chaperone HscC [Sphingobium sp. HBC34]MDO7833694.1 molecular chaperone HscC [Sphingobium sp. HBC34]
MILGIDLGTTNSAVAIWKDGVPTLIPNALGDWLTPSVVSLDADGTVHVGATARDRMTTDPDRTVASFKRYMGTQRRATLGRQDYAPEELSAFVLRSLKADAEAFCGAPVSDAVITVPAYFNDRQRKATRQAGELAGLTVRRLINEPTAAALAFGVHSRDEHEPFLVFDLGGGTFDVSIVEMFDGIVEVRASSGDNHLGGDDFNDCIVALARPAIDPDGALAAADPQLVEARLSAAAEDVKRALSVADEAEFVLVVGQERRTSRITAQALEEQAQGLLTRLRDPVLRSLRDSDIDVKALSEVVLVGGATRMPIVRKAITRMFGRFPNSSVHPDHAVALGAAVQAGLLEKDAALDEIRLTDVCPFTLGVNHSERDARGHMHHGLFSPIIERNTAIPVSRVERYQTMADNQRHIEFGIYQGEAREVSSNVKLGSISIPVPPRAAGEVVVDCRFSYDSSGLLEVDVVVPETGQTRNLVIVDESDRRSEKELAERRARLSALKFHPRDGQENVAALARARKGYEAFIGERREAIGHWITRFQSALETQDGRLIIEERRLLIQNLDRIEQDYGL